MRVVHRVSFARRDAILAELDRLGIGYSQDAVAFDIDEADSRWPAIRAMIAQKGGVDFCQTRFTPGELRSAEWLEVRPAWHYGYPMPDGDFGYLAMTYDLTQYCERCGTGKQQKACFRMRGEPRWGGRNILQLNWVFDEYFVRPTIWKSVFAPLGIGCWAVHAEDGETELRTVVQLRVDTILEAELAMGDHDFDICEFCQRKKYLPFSRGMFPALTKGTSGIHAVKSKEYFGDRGRAFRALLISQALFTRITQWGLKGAEFAVVAPG